MTVAKGGRGRRGWRLPALWLWLLCCVLSVPAWGAQRVVVDVIPTQASEKFRAQMQKLGRLLSQYSGLDVQIRIGTDYASVVEAMRFGKSDVAFLGPFTYVVAHAQSGAQAFITQTIRGKPYYYSYAIVHKDSPMPTLTDKTFGQYLRGQRVALGDRASTSGSQIPQLAMQRAGLTRVESRRADPAKNEVELIFTGAHDATLLAVANKKADIGFVDSAILEGSLAKKFPKEFSQVRVVWRSTELYQYPWAYRRGLDPQVVERLRAAFLKIKDPEVLEAFGADGFVVADDRHYQPIREAAAALGIDLARYRL